jgi:hypothetical protein
MVFALLLIGIVCLIVSFGLEEQSKIVYGTIGIIIMTIAGFLIIQAIVKNQPGKSRPQDEHMAEIEAQKAPTHFGGVSLEKLNQDE